jgi:catechol 2,3-dioxygenase-like lactoylglutathione lyase family enzyme
MAFRWDHVHLRSLDPERAAGFYVTMFGAAPLASTQTGAGLRCVVDLDGLKLFIEQVALDIPAAPDPPYRGLEHFGLAVENLDAAAAELRRRGAVFLMEPRTARPGLRVAFVQGPDNVRIELVDRTAA